MSVANIDGFRKDVEYVSEYCDVNKPEIMANVWSVFYDHTDSHRMFQQLPTIELAIRAWCGKEV